MSIAQSPTAALETNITESKSDTAAADCYVLQDSRSTVGDLAFWWANEGGYTSDLANAERFSRELAVSQHECRETDIPWPLAYLEPLAHVGVDHQYLKQAEAQTHVDGGGLFVVQKDRHFNGNDIYWLGEPGMAPSSDFRNARAMSEEEANELARQECGTAWPLAYIQGKCRTPVSTGRMNIKQALKGTGITLIKPRRPVKARSRCGGCGLFMSEAQFWTGSCNRCGADSRP